MKSIGLHGRVAVSILMGSVANSGLGAATDISNTPLASMVTQTPILPNLMFTLDASGSMAWDFLPDSVGYRAVSQAYNCRGWDSQGRGSETRVQCSDGNTSSDREPPYYASAYNKIFYNPQITYSPGVDPDSSIVGASVIRGIQSLNSAKINSYDNSGSINLETNFPEQVYCDSSNASANDTTHCQANTSGYLYPNGTYSYVKTRNSPAFYYDIVPTEYCDSANLVRCVLSSVPTGNYKFPAPVRHCKRSSDATQATAVANGDCQAKYDSSNFTYVRYGRFSRVDIVPTGTFNNRYDRSDCAAKASGICNYAEESINFANWYTYYRTRMQMMKTVAGQAFIPIDSRYRVGFITINPMNNSSSVDSSKYLPVDVFNISQKQAWYTIFYNQVPNGGTPLREALSRVGRYFAGKTTGINSGMTPDPVQYSCQRNFTILTTDGYWNGNAGINLSGNYIGNEDNVDGGYTSHTIGAYDPNPVPTNDYNSLADIAAYFYKTDLRSSMNNDVPTSAEDPNPAQHMVTYAIGMADGKLTYVNNYESNTSGDFYQISQQSTGTCWWQNNGVCTWPMPAANTDTAIDDLWHAAVNGHGRYFSAYDPVTLAAGLKEVLEKFKVDTAAASAAATSSPNITATDNGIFSATYRTFKWDGELVKETISAQTGVVSTSQSWTADSLLDVRVSNAAPTIASSDTRVIYTFDGNSASKLKSFQWASLTTGEQNYFASKGNQLHQYGSLSSGDQANANNGQLLLEYLRGRKNLELSNGGSFRSRDHVLGDTVSSTPVYVQAPRFNFSDTGYTQFKVANSADLTTSPPTSGRKAMLYVAANDGMLHAFEADTGQEAWAFVPHSLFPKLYKLASDDYDTHHEFYVDGSPTVMDAYLGGQWKTILVGGMNAGGRAYYALDITDPDNPKGLWEFCTDSSLCSVADNNLGYSYGNPIVTKDASGNWVVLVTSGYNNYSPGDGGGHLYVLNAATGAIQTAKTLHTGSGNNTNPAPSGLGKIAAWADNGDVNNTATYVYGADLNGDVWRFDMTSNPSSPNPLKLATLSDASSNLQSVTTKPELGLCGNSRMVYFGTGRYLGTSDLTNTNTQTVYGFKDTLGTVGLGTLRSSSQMVQQTISAGPNSTQRVVTSNTVNLASQLGWYADLIGTGERVNVDPQLVLGTLLVSGNIPDSSGGANACLVNGTSWQYQFDACTGSFVTGTPNGVLAQQMSATTAGFVVISLPDGSIKQIITDSTGKKSTWGVGIGATSGPGKRVGWREILN